MARSKSKRLKTPNGVGSITLRKDGLWMARFTTTDPATGRSIRPTLYGATEQEARAKLIEALAGRNQGRPLATGRGMTVEQWAERWLASRQRRARPQKTG